MSMTPPAGQEPKKEDNKGKGIAPLLEMMMKAQQMGAPMPMGGGMPGMGGGMPQMPMPQQMQMPMQQMPGQENLALKKRNRFPNPMMGLLGGGM